MRIVPSIGLFLSLPLQALTLSEQEQLFLDELVSIRMCVDPDWLPYDGIDREGQHIGIMSDFHRLWSQKIGKAVELVPTDSWQQSLGFIQAKRCDILSSAQEIPGRQHYLAVTDPFIFYPFAVATQPDNQFVINLDQIKEHEFVMVQGYAGVEMLRRGYPDLNILTVDTPREGLKLVETGQAYGYIDTVPTINYQMLRHGISHLKISGVLEQQYAMSVGIGRHALTLQSIYDKAIGNTSETERQQILKNWLSVTLQSPISKTLIGQIVIVILLLVGVLLYRYRVVKRHNQRLKHINAELAHMSQNDQLTGIANRYLLHQRLHQEMKANRTAHHSFSIMIMDVDHFKKINDVHGHDVGDQIIQEIAALLTAMIREQDLVGRWGGEEFLIICPQTSQHGAMQLAEQIRSQIQQHVFAIDTEMTVSIGVSEYLAGEDINTCIKRADDALYQAKHLGRNQTVMAPLPVGS
ncbi:MAG: diguanylate cyclase [Methylophaga sp.]